MKTHDPLWCKLREDFAKRLSDTHDWSIVAPLPEGEGETQTVFIFLQKIY